MSNTGIEQSKCIHCGAGSHDGQCPKIKSVEYHPDGSIKKVEYHQKIETTRVRAYYPPAPRRRRRQSLGEWIFGC